MAEIDRCSIEELIAKSNGIVTEDIILFAKNFLIEQIKKYASENEVKIAKNRLQELKIKIVTKDEFERIFYENGGKGALAAAFVHQGTIYLNKDKPFLYKDFHVLIHEMLHVISNNGDKIGLFQFNKEKDKEYGYAFNEAFTEYLASLLLGDEFSSYSKDLKYIIELFMALTGLSINELFSLYISPHEWLTEDIAQRLDVSLETLKKLVKEYDNLIPVSKTKEFEPNLILNTLFEMVNCKMAKGSLKDSLGIKELLEKLFDYYGVWWELTTETKENMGILLESFELSNSTGGR